MLSYLVSLVIFKMWVFPIFKNYPRKKAELVSIPKFSFLKVGCVISSVHFIIEFFLDNIFTRWRASSKI